MTRFIIGTIARMDRPLTPSQKGELAVRRYFYKTTNEEIQKEREAVIATTAEDIKGMEKLVKDVLVQDAFCVYGNEQKIKAEKEVFGSLVPLSE